jgi:ArsR family transcriptional regulator, arsenate/arsenite/antimonite-responsive transcriptional repressor
MKEMQRPPCPPRKHLTFDLYFDNTRNMKTKDRRTDYYAELFKAIGSAPRLQIVRLLVTYGEMGCCVGDIQKEVGGANSTLSHHLQTLQQQGLIHSRKKAQWIYYSLNFATVNELLHFLMEDCCSRSRPLVTIQNGQLDS